MSFTVFLGNLPTWVTADDIKQWLAAEDLVADAVKVIRNHETQESKGFAFVEAPTNDEMQSIIRRFDRAPLEDRLLRANPAQPPKGKDAPRDAPRDAQRDAPRDAQRDAPRGAATSTAPAAVAPPPNGIRTEQRPDRKKRGGRNREQSPRSAFATELAKVL
jgi:RNA recognition motif-containing protein